MQKVRGHTCLRRTGNIVLPLIVGLRFHILFHSPHRGAFHLSLTVLVHYRSPTVFSLRRWSSQIPARFLVSRRTWVFNPEWVYLFAHRAITVYGQAFQPVKLKYTFVTFRRIRSSAQLNPTTPDIQRPRALTYSLVWALPRSFATTRGITFVFFSSGY